uniref:U-box domain-containing protein n=1 Tax=Hucho hucho TaxID=62062 RepID=A0A4W5RS44_9TELE
MKDPVIAADGYSYEREAIESWIATKNRSSPMTNLPSQTTLLTQNRTLKMAIVRWRTSQLERGMQGCLLHPFQSKDGLSLG